jgi:hypothetical protein
MIALFITIVSAAYSTSTIKLNANLDELVSEDLDYHRRYLDFLEEFGDEEYLYVVADSAGDMTRAKQFIMSLAARLQKVDGLKHVIWKIDNPVLERNFLLYLTPKQLDTIRGILTEGPFTAGNIASWQDFAPLFGGLADRISKPVSAEDEEELSQGFTFIDDLLGGIAAVLSGGTPNESGMQSLFFGDDGTFDADGFYRNGDLFFLMIMPEKDFTTMEVIEKPLADIRWAISETRAEFPGLDAGLTGRPVLSADEIATSDRDMTRATLLAIVLVGIFFMIFFGSISRPVLAMFSLIMGISWTFGVVALLYGTLNLLSIVFTLILIGASIEYAIHLVARYQEELSQTGDIETSMSRALVTSGRADLTSAFTTAAAFLTIIWSDFTALSELGIIAASGIILCLTAMLVVLPAMITLRDRKRAPMDLKKVRPFAIPGLAFIYRKPWVLAVASLVVTAIFVPFISRTGFDNNLLNLQAKGLESVKYEHLIIDKSSETTWFARAIADSIEESEEKTKLFAALPTVRRVDDIERILPKNQQEKQAIVSQIAPAFKNLTFAEPSGEVDRKALVSELEKIADALGRLENDAFSAGRTDAVKELEKFGARVREAITAMEGAAPEMLSRLGEFQRAFLEDLQKNLGILSTGMNPDKIVVTDLPEDLVARFKSPKGRYALFIYPKDNIWDPDALSKFVADIRKVDEESLGTPIEVHESSRLMRATFVRSAVLAFIIICLLVWMDFRSFRCVLLAVAPLVVGLLWLFGAMGLFGIPFNMANFFAIPILIGIGVDFGVHLVHRLKRERSLSAMTTSTGKGVILTAVTNAVGFGAMMMAAHQGISSLGQIMAVGAVCCLAAALVALPPLAKFFNFGRGMD